MGRCSESHGVDYLKGYRSANHFDHVPILAAFLHRTTCVSGHSRALSLDLSERFRKEGEQDSVAGIRWYGIKMKKTTKHVFIPFIVPAVFFAIVLSPVELLGCRTRGLIAGLVGFTGGLLGLAAVVGALIGRVRGDTNSSLWVASALILAIPAVFTVLFAT